MRWRGDSHKLLGSLRLSRALCSTFRSLLAQIRRRFLGDLLRARRRELGRAEDGLSALQKPSTPVIADIAATPAGRVSPASPAYCKVLAHIEPNDPNAPPIRFELNLPVEWNGRALQYGGGGINGVVITGLGLPPAMPFDSASPLARGFATYGTDSGHESKPGEPPQIFALNDEAFLNFAHVAYKKVHDAAVTLIERAYGREADRTYFMGSSEGGREALTMVQRYPKDFDGIFARVPVINWTGLQHAGARSGLVTMGDGWIRPGQVKLVHDAVLSACGAVDGNRGRRCRLQGQIRSGDPRLRSRRERRQLPE